MKDRKIILVCILLTTLLFIPSKPYAGERYNYGKIWKSWTNYTRYVFLWGFQEGINSAYFKSAKGWLEEREFFTKPETLKVKKVRESVFLFFDIESIRDVVTDLYQDPANTYIPFDKIVYIARDKLKGESIEEPLMKTRKETLNSYLLQEKLEQKRGKMGRR